MDPFWPGLRPPRLDEALSRQELELPAHDVAAERRERRAFDRLPGRRCTRDRGELLQIGEGFVHAGRGSGERRLLMNAGHPEAPFVVDPIDKPFGILMVSARQDVPPLATSNSTPSSRRSEIR